MADIFISYSKSSWVQTEQLAKELQAQGLTVWWDTSLVPGDRFRNVILSELEQRGQCKPSFVIPLVDQQAPRGDRRYSGLNPCQTYMGSSCWSDRPRRRY